MSSELEIHLQKQEEKPSEGIDFFWHKLRTRFVMNKLKSLLPDFRTARVLDIGAGAGIFGLHLQKRFPRCQYFFSEPIESLAIRLTALFGTQSRVFPTQPITADVAVLMDVLEHQADDIDFLKSIHARMKDNALIILTCPAFQSLWSRWDEKLGHFRRYDRTSIERVVTAAGFHVIESRYLFQTMYFVGLIRKIKVSKSSEFPDLGFFTNFIIYTLGVLEQIFLSKFAPFGSSVAVVAKKQVP